MLNSRNLTANMNKDFELKPDGANEISKVFSRAFFNYGSIDLNCYSSNVDIGNKFEPTVEEIAKMTIRNGGGDVYKEKTVIETFGYIHDNNKTGYDGHHPTEKYKKMEDKSESTKLIEDRFLKGKYKGRFKGTCKLSGKCIYSCFNENLYAQDIGYDVTVSSVSYINGTIASIVTFKQEELTDYMLYQLNKNKNQKSFNLTFDFNLFKTFQSLELRYLANNFLDAEPYINGNYFYLLNTLPKNNLIHIDKISQKFD